MAEWFVLAVFQFCMTLTIFVHAQDPPGFISFDCGLPLAQKYRDINTNLTYHSDGTFIDSGERHSISPEYVTDSLERQFWYVRSFPEAEGNRNCYSLNTFIPDISSSLDDLAPDNLNSKQYIIRARFMYGNYDHKNSLPKFDLYLGATFWDSVEFEDESTIITKEFRYPALYDDFIHVCLCNTNQGTPFISVLERRVILDNFGFLIGMVLARYNLGSDEGKVVRYPDDAFDRIWTPYASQDLYHINTSHPEKIDESDRNDLPPSIVMATAAIPANGKYITLKFHPRFNASDYYPMHYFAEIQKLHGNQIREFEVSMREEPIDFIEPYRPRPFYAEFYSLGVQGKEGVAAPRDGWQIWINRTRNSTLPPILNAIEMIQFKDISPSQTDRNDYEAINKVKRMYGITRNWQGDPCMPRAYIWEGLNCSNNGSESDPYRITHLDLSSSGLNENIAPWISDMIHLRYLDLSNNKLYGNIPDSLSQLKSLTFLNIEENKLTGTVPTELIKRSNNSQLRLRWKNSGLCYPGPCKERHKGNVVIAVAATFGAAFIIVLFVITFFIFKKKQVGKNPKTQGFYSDISRKLMLLSNIDKKVRSKKQRLTYAEILSITNNFERIVGKGGFGTVYHGQIGNTQVAVKMLSPSTQGFQQFQTEANLLTRVHHKCLTPLLGYCHEGSNIALIYEYMPNGDLAKHLSDNEKHFSWKQRIQIAVDAAEGLEYLHDGCKPPIIHRDIKPRNILLNEQLRGKIADFGLSRIFPNEGDTHMFTLIAGTPGYLAPEYYTSNRLNEKSDVFSFGVLLLELITAQPVITKTDEKTHIIQWVGSMMSEREIHDILDSRLQGEFDISSARKALDTALACVAPKSINRPSMSQVAMELKQCLAMETTPDSDVNGCTSNNFFESNTSDMLTDVFNSVDRVSVESSLLG